MGRRLPQAFHVIAGLLAVAAYALPSTVGVLSVVGHAASHLAEDASEQRRIAASLGLTHLEDAPARVAQSIPQVEGRVIHTHGGSTHAHDGLVGDLLSASDAAEGQLVAVPTAPSLLGLHIPAPEMPSFVPAVSSELAGVDPSMSPKSIHPNVPPRPPRA